jgi:hypothetical protein
MRSPQSPPRRTHAGLCEIAAIYVAIGAIQERGAGIPAETIDFRFARTRNKFLTVVLRAPELRQKRDLSGASLPRQFVQIRSSMGQSDSNRSITA